MDEEQKAKKRNYQKENGQSSSCAAKPSEEGDTKVGGLSRSNYEGPVKGGATREIVRKRFERGTRDTRGAGGGGDDFGAAMEG